MIANALANMRIRMIYKDYMPDLYKQIFCLVVLPEK